MSVDFPVDFVGFIRGTKNWNARRQTTVLDVINELTDENHE